MIAPQDVLSALGALPPAVMGALCGSSLTGIVVYQLERRRERNASQCLRRQLFLLGGELMWWLEKIRTSPTVGLCRFLAEDPVSKRFIEHSFTREYALVLRENEREPVNKAALAVSRTIGHVVAHADETTPAQISELVAKAISALETLLAVMTANEPAWVKTADDR